MPLSVIKLQDFLSSKGFITNKFFVMDGYCFFIEIFCLKTADIFLLYIPSKYNIQINNEENSFKIKYININTSDNLANEYAGQLDNLDIEDRYGNNQVELSDKIETNLENNYKHSISLSDIDREDMIDLKGVYRQLKRLKYCVQNLDYKLGIVYKNYICSIKRDDTICCFYIKNYPRSNEHKRLLIIADLEIFYEKKEKTIEDIYTVRKSIYHVLERNQSVHGQLIGKIIENKKDIVNIPKLTENKKEKYDIMLRDLNEMLEIMNTEEKKILEEIFKNNGGGIQNGIGISNDINRVHLKAKLDKDLDRVNIIKNSITKYLLITREKLENTILSIDKIMFDNTVMFDCMVKNFSKLKDFC